MKLGKSIKIGSLQLKEPKVRQPFDIFGVDAHVGPKGSGKTALAVLRAYRFSQGLVKNAEGGCLCGSPDCLNKWNAYSNMESTHIDNPRSNGKGWAQPLNLAEHLLTMESDVKHSIFLLDEAYQIVDSRRSMTNNALAITDQVTQSRKVDVLMLVTGVSFDWIDSRLRAQTRQVYNCWSPNRGKTVYGIVSMISAGHLPPWIRARTPTGMYRWNTEPILSRYDTRERMNSREELKLATEKRRIFIRDENGDLRGMELSDYVAMITYREAHRGAFTLSVGSVMQEVTTNTGIEVSESYITGLLKQFGLWQNSDGLFVIQAKHGLEELAHEAV